FVNLKYPAYEKITREFLSSVEAEILQGKDCEEGLIAFRLHNVSYRLTLVEFNAIFGFPAGGKRNYLRSFDAWSFWDQLSQSSSFVSSDSKEANIQNPCFRYAHRLMAHTLFARGDSPSAVRKSELLFLWGMVNEVQFDSGAWLARQFLKVGKASSGQIAIDGLITVIALHFNISL
ncbi:hypothetical protein V8G54_005420, partial [Vigna mungo]